MKNIHFAAQLNPQPAEKRRACSAVPLQRKNMVRCPQCGHSTIGVFEDTRGHVQAKCKKCGRETVFEVISVKFVRPYISTEK